MVFAPIRRLRLEPLEPRVVLSADVMISEFLASNTSGILDFEGDDPDWVEFLNRGPSRVDLQGWYVTDSQIDLMKWQFPISTVLEPEDRLIVFASGKDLVAPNGELHTGFKLNTDGEFLALIDPAGTIVHSYAPTFPPQASNISYGIDEDIQVTPLVPAGATARAIVPASDSLGTSWTGGDKTFSDVTWTSGTTGVGFETRQMGPTVAAPIAYWSFDELLFGGSVAPDVRGRYDGTVSGATLTTGQQGKFGEALSFDGDDDYVLPGVIAELVDASEFSISLWFRRTFDHAGAAAETSHIVNNVLISQSSNFSNDNLEIGTEGDAVEVYLDTVELGGPTTTVSLPASIQNDTWQHLVVSYDSGDASELKLYVDGALVSEHDEYGGLLDTTTSPFTIGLSRPGSSTWGDFEGLIDDVAVWDAALDSQHVSALFSRTSPLLLSGYTALVGLDLENQLQNPSENSSAYVRIPFSAIDPESFELLKLRMQYDDAFVAYINGTEVARSNVTGTPLFNSAPDADRFDGEALLAEEFIFANHSGLLVDGQNVLAIQLLNVSATRALVLPELDAIDLPHIELLIGREAIATSFVPADATLGTSWTGATEPFDDVAWTSGTTGAGYDTSQVGADAPLPISYWTFDALAAGGTLAPDTIGNYDGVVTGATLTSGGQGRFGEALSFDGDNDYVLPGVIAELVDASEFSISLWFRRTFDHDGVAAETSHIVNNVLISQSSNFSNDNLEIGTEGDAVEVYLDTVELGGPTTTVSQPASIQNDTWQHLVVSYDSGDASELKLYVDGALVSEHDEYGGLLDTTTSPFTIGLSRPGSSTWGDFEGLIDDVAVWDAALDGQQVSALFGGTSPLLFAYADHIGLDLEAQLAKPNENTSAYVRVPFTVVEPDDVVALNLAMQYDDAFVAYINGTEIARSNVMGTPQWNSIADVARPDIESLTPEEFIIANHPGLLQAGQNILAVHVLNASAGSERLLVLPRLRAEPLPDKLFSFMDTPTPGAENVSGVQGQVADIWFSEDHGFFDDPLDVVITTDTVGADIRYTLDGKIPTETNGITYTGPIHITTTTTLRASAFKPNYFPSNVNTHTYIFLDDVLTQTGEGYPNNWGHAGADYAMDPDVVNNPAYSGTIKDDLKSVPTLSLVMDPDDMFKSGQGIYLQGESIERAVSAEWIQPDGSEGFQVDAAIQIQGGYSTTRWVLDKLSMRLKFKRPFGPSQLEYRLFDDSQVDRFNTLILDATFNSGWASDPTKVQYIKDQFVADLQQATGGYSHHNKFAHLYINGLYWGMYGIHERTDESFAAAYFGGNPEDYDVLKDNPGSSFPGVVNGSTSDYRAMFNVARSGVSGDEQYELLQTYLDVPGFIDYMLVNFYAGNQDWGDNNFYASRSRVDPNSRWRYHSWDAEISLRGTRENVTGKNDNNGPTGLHQRLRLNAEYRLLFADHMHRHFFNGGLLSPEGAAEIYQRRLAEIDRAIVAESARWGDNRRPNQPHTRDVEWVAERDRLLNNYFPVRTDIVFGQLQSYSSPSLYPSVTAPRFNQHGGVISEGFELTITAPTGTIYYTLDGLDPRFPGGGISPTAQLYGGAVPVNTDTIVKARVWDADEWSALNEAPFAIALALDITEINYNPHDPSAEESATIPGVDSDDFEFIEIYNSEPIKPIELANMTLSGGVQFTFPDVRLDPGDYAIVVEDIAAFQQRYGTSVNVLGEWRGKLSNDGEQLILSHGTGIRILDFAYDDNEFWPRQADGFGSTLELIAPGNTPRSDLGSFDRWQGSIALGGSPGTAGAGPVGVVINEVITRTNVPDLDAIELHNTTASPVNVTGWWLSDSTQKFDKFVIPSTTIPAGGYVFFDENDFNASGDPLLDFALNGISGDEVWLVKPDAAGTRAELLVDQVEFGAGLGGESFGRWPNGTGRLNPMISTTLGAANNGPRVGPVVISEIMYNAPSPPGGSHPSQLEFVELYNTAPWAKDLARWEIDGIDFQFSAGDSIGAGQTIVIVRFDPVNDAMAIANFQETYHVNIGAGPSQYLGPYREQVDNDGEQLTLFHADDPPPEMPMVFPLATEDRVLYNDQAPWPTTADGFGDSLHRIGSDAWAGDVAAWESGLPNPGSFGPRVLFETSASELIVGEVGRVTTLTHVPQVIQLNHTYTNPVVFAQPASSNGLAPVVVRVADLQSDQFNIFLAEPSNLDGIHTGESVSYVVLEAGIHWLPDGTHLEVGSVNTNAMVGISIPSPTWETVNFTSQFTDTPVVLSQTQTTSGEVFLSTRQQAATSAGFQVALEPEEQFGSEHSVETVGYLAIDAGISIWNEIPFLAAQERFVHSRGRTVNFTMKFTGMNFDTVPIFVASLASYAGYDNAHLRVDNADLNRILVRSEEDTTVDEENEHINENVAYLAIGGSGSLTAVSTPLVDGLTQTFPLEIAGLGVVNDLGVGLELVHSRLDDLDIFLEAPDGTIVELFTDIGGTSGDVLATTLDDEAAEAIWAAASPISGSFQPEGLLRDFDGKAINGTWFLHVTDDMANGDAGALLNWSLNIELAPDPPGNLNHDSHVNATDIDMLFANIGSSDPTYDLDSDGDTDMQDVDHLVLNIMGKRYGDTDLDQKVDISDFSAMVRNYNPLGRNAFYSWAQGNFNGDDRIDLADFNRLVMNFSPLGYSPTSVIALAETLAMAPQPQTGQTVMATSPTGAEEGLPPTVSEPGTARLADIRSVHVGHPLDGVDNSTGEYLVVDHYFRSSRRKHSRLSEND